MTTPRTSFAIRVTLFTAMIVSLLFAPLEGISRVEAGSPHAEGNFAIVFVSRAIPRDGSLYYHEAGSMPGVGPYSRFQLAAPGKLIVRAADGTLQILIDGSNPMPASLNLIDVNAPDVSYDGTKIVFSGLPAGSYDPAPLTNPGAWRIYVINVDGTGLRQVTFSDQDNLDLSQFRDVARYLKAYDDTDPVWLPDGRIAFSSTRWPSFGQYSAARTSNLHVVNADGTNLHRITAERNGADRPLVDPITGKIVYSRWWRNFRFAVNRMDTIYVNPSNPDEGYMFHNGLTSDRGNQLVRHDYLNRNIWHPVSINPDGTSLALWTGGSFRTDIDNLAYGGAFTPNGDLIANFFPMHNLTEAAGFGGLRKYERGPHGYQGIIGVIARDENLYQIVRENPPSFAIYRSNYATEPEVLPDGRLIISLANNIAQDYGLYIINADGSGLTPLYDNPGTTELRARLIRTRPLPPIIPDKVTQVASLLPPLENGPYDVDGTYTFQALNVYFNAPVDTYILNAMPVGSANTIRFFIDHQRWQQRGSIESLDWPILLKETPVNPDGSVTANAPANVPLFEQIRTANPAYTVPLTGMNAVQERSGAAHVAGMNFGRPGEVVKCVGCHAGHSLIPVPANPADAQWTNLAPGAKIKVSSLSSSLRNSKGLIDRRVKIPVPVDTIEKFWISSTGLVPNSQWVQLTFPVPVTVRTVRLYNIPQADSSIQVQATTVKLYSDAARTNEVASKSSGALSENGTDVTFNDVRATVVRIEINAVNGSAAGLAEVEVIARAEEKLTSFPPPTTTSTDTTGVFRPSNGLLYLKNTHNTGFADVAINYGVPGDYPVVGDWNGDGTVTIGIYRNGSFYLRNSNTLGFADLVFAFGQPGDQPIAGDWDGDGVDTIGVYRPSNGQFLLRNRNSAGSAQMSFYLGNVGDVGIAGDWDGDGLDTTGVFRPVNGIIFLKNANTTGFADVALNYGIPGDKPVIGDWNNDGIDTIGVYRNGTFYLRNSNTIGFAEIVFGLGNPGDMPIAGEWDGVP